MQKLPVLLSYLILSETQLKLHLHTPSLHLCSPILLQGIRALEETGEFQQSRMLTASKVQPSVKRLIVAKVHQIATSHRRGEEFQITKNLSSAAEMCRNCSGRRWRVTRCLYQKPGTLYLALPSSPSDRPLCPFPGTLYLTLWWSSTSELDAVKCDQV